MNIYPYCVITHNLGEDAAASVPHYTQIDDDWLKYLKLHDPALM